MRLHYPTERVRVLANVSVPTPTTLQKGKRILEDLMDSADRPIMKSTVILLDGWHLRPPDSTQFKLNLDTSWSMSSFGYGGLIHDLQGMVRITFIGVIMHSPFPELSETIVVGEGLR